MKCQGTNCSENGHQGDICHFLHFAMDMGIGIVIFLWYHT